MKAMIFSDLITSKNSILTLLGVTVLIAIFIAIPTGTLYGAIGACAAMIPFMYLFSISAYDEMNGWERFRLTLPISRRQVAYGRYASMLIVCVCSLVIAIALGLLIGLVVDALPGGIVPEGLRLSNAGVGEVIGVALLTQVVILLVATLTLPFILRYGMTKATRIAPMVLIFAISGLAVLLGNTPIVGELEVFLGGMGQLQTALLGVGAVVIVVLHAGNIPAAFRAIFRGAFNLQAAGGGTLGYGISQSLTWGFKRGAFSNEAGLGSAVMVNSSANVKEPVQQGMWGVFEIFADTIVVCTITALVILTTGVVDIESGSVLAGVQDNALVGQAFTAAFGSFGPKFIAISLLFFAYSTVLGWSHYGTKAVEYLFGQKGTRVYKVIFVGMVVVGATMKLGLAWNLSDTFNGLMMIPNLIGVLVLSGTVVDITRNYFARRVRGEDIEPMWSAFEEYQKEEEAEAAAEKAELEKAANK